MCIWNKDTSTALYLGSMSAAGLSQSLWQYTVQHTPGSHSYFFCQEMLQLQTRPTALLLTPETGINTSIHLLEIQQNKHTSNFKSAKWALQVSQATLLSEHSYSLSDSTIWYIFTSVWDPFSSQYAFYLKGSLNNVASVSLCECLSERVKQLKYVCY